MMSDVLKTIKANGLDAPTLGADDPRWTRLQFEAEQARGLHDRFRGALIGGVIGDAMGRANEGVRTSEARGRVRKMHEIRRE
jgi:hypothetical protein